MLNSSQKHVLFKNLEVEIFSKGASKKELANDLGISYGTFLCKLSGKYPFTLDEALQIKNILMSDVSIEELFRTNERSA